VDAFYAGIMRLFNQQRRLERSVPQVEGAPSAGDVIVEIGLVVALHLAFALAVTLTLNGYG
jgi:hypothetical protein